MNKLKIVNPCACTERDHAYILTVHALNKWASLGQKFRTCLNIWRYFFCIFWASVPVWVILESGTPKSKTSSGNMFTEIDVLQ